MKTRFKICIGVLAIASLIQSHVFAQGNGLFLDGNNDYVDISGVNASFDAASNLTMMCWVKTNSSSNHPLVAKYGGDVLNRTHIWVSGTTIFWNVSNGAHAYGESVHAGVNSGWNHVALVFDGSASGNSNRLKAYFNGEAVALTFTGTIPATTTNQPGLITIGRSNTSYASSNIDEVKIFSASLSQVDIQNQMYEYLSLPAANLLAYYKLDESAGTTADNAEGTAAYDGTLHNFAGTFWKISGVPTRWDGTSSTDWSTDANWSWGTKPVEEQKAIIPARANQPLIDATDAVCNDLQINNGSILTINSAKALTVGGDVDNEGSVIIKSDESTSASFVNTGAITGAGTFTVERFASKRKYHYIASPISNHAKTAFSSAKDFYEYVPGAGWNDLVGSGGNLTNAKGYIVQKHDADVTYSFTGTPNTGTVTISASRVGADGHNLIGNPYPSTIDLSTSNPNSFLSENAGLIAGTVYLWDDPGTFGGYASNDYATFNGTTGVAGNRGGNQPTRYISACQAFFVIRNDPGAGDVDFTDDMKVAQNSPHFYSPEELGKKQILRLSLENDQNAYNQIAIGFLEEASLGFDNLYDARKMKANPSLAFYSILDEEELVIQGLPKLEQLGKTSIPLGIDAISVGEYSINAEDLKDFKETTSILLEDLLEERIIDLKEVSSYSFYVHAEQRIADRFVLHVIEAYSISDPNNNEPNNGCIKDITTSIEESENSLQIYAYGKRLYILNNGSASENMMLSLNDILGKNLLTKNIHLNAFNSIPLDLPSGYYFVSMQKGTEIFTEKIYLGE
jgi:hypothetical protein